MKSNITKETRTDMLKILGNLGLPSDDINLCLRALGTSKMGRELAVVQAALQLTERNWARMEKKELEGQMQQLQNQLVAVQKKIQYYDDMAMKELEKAAQY